MEGFKKILAYADEYRGKLKAALAYIFASVVIGILPYLFLYRLLIAFIETKEVTLQLILVNGIGIGITWYFKTWALGKGLSASHELAYDTLMGMRAAFAKKMMVLPMGVINEQGTGAYKKNFVDDIEQMEGLFAHIIPEGLPYLMSPIVVFCTLLIIDWRLALLSLGSIPFGLIPVILMMVTGVKKMKLYYASEKEMNKTVVEYISGMEVIKVFNRTTSSFEKYSKNVISYRDMTLDWFRDSWTYMALYTSVLPCTILLLLPIGSLFYVNGSLTLSKFILALLMTMSIGIPLVKLMEFMPSIPNISYKIEQLEQTFDGEELNIRDTGQIPGHYDVSFENVTFAYNEAIVVEDVSFKAKNNTVTAIVGESGSGKSTLARLLVHYWDVKDGDIKIGNVSINNMSMDRLMDLVSYVSQDTFLFNISIMENIRLGRPNASDEEVMKAAKMAQCHDFVSQLTRGYDTMPGEAGNKLSGGEKQRITIARAILKDAPIIVLDEATSSTDPENEDLIQDALNKLIKGKTLIVIAHHLSTIENAQQIVLLDGGRIEGIGKHQELMASSAIYKQLWFSYERSSEWDIRTEVAN